MAVAPRLGCPIPSEPTMGNLFVYWARGACITPLSCASPYANVSGYHPCLASVKKHCREIYAGRRQNHHVSCPRRPARLHHRQVPRLSSLSKCLCAQPRFDRGSDMYCAPLPHPLKSQPPPQLRWASIRPLLGRSPEPTRISGAVYACWTTHPSSTRQDCVDGRPKLDR